MRKGIDCHIHTFYQRCGNETMSIPNIIRRAEAIGLKTIAITDHLNTIDRLERFRYIKADIEAVRTDIEVFFGVELNYPSCDGEFVYSEEIHHDYGFEVVIGGIHSPYCESLDPQEVLAIQHHHFMKTMGNPLVNVLVHPFWFSRTTIEERPAEYWESLLASIPDTLVDAWAAASVKHQCAIEVNASAMFFNNSLSCRFKRMYIDLIRKLADRKAWLTVGSDAHDINALGKSFYVEGILHGLGIPESQIWKPETARLRERTTNR